jgi:hypothetical protein
MFVIIVGPSSGVTSVTIRLEIVNTGEILSA